MQTKDSLTKIDGKESICKVIEYNEKINTPAIIEGRNIENENECLLDSAIIRTGKGAENEFWNEEICTTKIKRPVWEKSSRLAATGIPQSENGRHSDLS